jgi:2-iminobutanoate/2-iminopropanoate deaminase
VGNRTVLKRTVGSYRQPIPMGAKVGNVVFSSSILGWDPRTKELPEDSKMQAELLFKHIREFTEQLGASPDCIVYILLEFHPEHYNQCINTINEEWLKMFPDENDRPARHSIAWIPLEPGSGKAYFRAEIVAVV